MYKQIFINLQQIVGVINKKVSMKTGFKRFLGIVCLLLLLGPAAASAKCKCGKPPKENAQVEKIYLNPTEINILEKQILVKIEDEAMPAFALYTDQEGIYVLTKRGRDQGRCPEEYWECGTCGGCTPWHSPDCDWCGYN
jgi:hypothetical protein